MKRVGFIYNKIYSEENIRLAIKCASKRKRHHRKVLKVLVNKDFYIAQIADMLKNKTYIPSPPIKKVIIDGPRKKVRTIYKPAFYPDQIIHWALMNQIQPILMRGMYKYNCGSVPKRGTGFAQKYLKKILIKDRKNTKYCLKMDIQKYYPSIDNETLKQMFRKKIKDKDCLWLIDTIIDSAKGQPIGFYTSQWFSNFFLEEFDHFVKQELKAKYYIRYVDDLVILGPNKKKLHKIRISIEEYLADLKLSLKHNWQVFITRDRGVDFLGLRFFGTYTTLRRKNCLRMRRRVKKAKEKNKLNFRDACAVVSYWGWIKMSNSYNFYKDKIKAFIPIHEARKAVSVYAKQNARI